MKNAAGKKLGYWETAAIGVGGMVGGGIFAVLGMAVLVARGGSPVAFLVAGLVALLTAYSYTKMSIAFPSQGGTVTFLDRAFGAGLFTGGLNILLWLSYIVMLSLYSFAFGSYGAALFPAHLQPLFRHLLISFSIVAITGLNMLNTQAIGRAELLIVAVKLSILLLFAGLGFVTIEWGRLAPAAWSPPLNLVAGGMIIFLAYEGFELIANTAHDVERPKRTLPKAYFSAVIFVIILYVLVAGVAVGNLSVPQIVKAQDYALAEAARPFMGEFGFILIAVAALLSTASAINATLYGAARLSYTIARDGELPPILEKKVWNRPAEGLLITAGITLIVANVFDLSSISMMGSAGFLIIFAAVNLANAHLHRQTGSRPWISIAGALACGLALAALIWHTMTTQPVRIWVLVAMIALSFLIEGLYRLITRREIRVSHTIRPRDTEA